MSKITGFTSGPTTSGFGTWHAATLDCGHKFYATRGPLNAQIGAEVECETCQTNARDLEWLQALDASTVQHARYNERFGGRYLFYKRDTTSPTGVMLIGGVGATREIDALLRVKGISPLSPTEQR